MNTIFNAAAATEIYTVSVTDHDETVTFVTSDLRRAVKAVQDARDSGEDGSVTHADGRLLTRREAAAAV